MPSTSQFSISYMICACIFCLQLSHCTSGVISAFNRLPLKNNSSSERYSRVQQLNGTPLIVNLPFLSIFIYDFLFEGYITISQNFSNSRTILGNLSEIILFSTQNRLTISSYSKGHYKASESVSANRIYLIPNTVIAVSIAKSKQKRANAVTLLPHSYLKNYELLAFYIPYIELICSLRANYLTSDTCHSTDPLSCFF